MPAPDDKAKDKAKAPQKLLEPLQRDIADVLRPDGKPETAEGKAGREELQKKLAEEMLAVSWQKLGDALYESKDDKDPKKNGVFAPKEFENLLAIKKDDLSDGAKLLETAVGKLSAADKADAKDLAAHAQEELAKISEKLKDQLEKLYKSPSDFKEEEWNALFDSAIKEFNKTTKVCRDAVINTAAAVTEDKATRASEKPEVEARKKERLDAIEKLEKHFKSEVETLRDRTLFEAMHNHKKVAGAHAAVGEEGRWHYDGESNLKEMAEYRRVQDHSETMKRLWHVKNNERGLTWTDYEKVENEEGLAVGQYSTLMTNHEKYKVLTHMLNHSLRKDFEIVEDEKDKTKKIIRFKESWFGDTVENYAIMLDVFHITTGLKSGVLDIDEKFSFSNLERMAKAVQERSADPVTLTLSDESIKNVLKKKIFARNPSHENLAKVCVKLAGVKEGAPGYQEKVTQELERIKKIQAEMDNEKLNKGRGGKEKEADKDKNEAAGAGPKPVV